MHGTEFKRRSEDLPPVAIGSFRYIGKLLVELAKSKVGWGEGFCEKDPAAGWYGPF